MSLIRKFKAGYYARKLRAGSSLTTPAVAQVKLQLVSLGPSAVHSMIELLSTGGARRPALDVLESLVSEETLPEYFAALESRDPSVGNGIAEVLAKSRRYDPVQLLDLFSNPAVPKARIEAILSEQMEKLPPRLLITLLADVGKEARAVVFRLIEQHRDRSIVPQITSRLNHPDWWVRQHMIRLVGDFEAVEGIPGVIEQLDDENKGVRLEAARVLGILKSTEAIPALCRRLVDDDMKVRTAVIDSLMAIHDTSMVPHLVAVLKNESEHARRGAVEVLNEVVTPDAVKDLVSALRDEDWWVRVRAADALGSLGGDRVVDAVVGLLDDPDEFVRRYAVEILNTVPDKKAVDFLIQALADSDWWVRERSIDALARNGDTRAVEPLLSLLASDAKAAPFCVRALGAIGDARALDTITHLIRTADPELKREAGQALQAFARHRLEPAVRNRVDVALKEAGLTAPPAGAPLEVRGATAAPLEDRATPLTPQRASGASSNQGTASPKNLQNLSAGDLLAERYRIREKVGGGGFGTVYRVEDILVKEELVLKILSPFLSSDESIIQRFIQELKLTRGITHPGVIRIYDIVNLGNGHAISMEFFRSRDLSRLIHDDGAMSPARVVPIALQICEGLAAAHESGVVHRDMKPANILIGEDDRVKIVDFGLAAVGQQVGSRLTKSGLLIGTPEYIAPEQIKGGTADFRSDVYSLGIVLYEMLSGRPPYSGDNTVNVLFQHIEGEHEPLSLAAPLVPATLAAVVERAMAREPEDRPASAGELKRLLAAA